ncbi:hypothetical protein OG369_39240 [Streptomyces sp. NBC_01221]|uniref:hypothetical protein n=1 Tax=Streptomyces sp. NBC_01221 TaxID=2903782 RepID=UPI00224F0805|nr:hypothetical protein [Streptomyces sp. NBC_01221]MCX4791895.1 hypothetical protein [Streptomyces sp. NBC_01221]
MYLFPMLFRFTASGSTPESAFDTFGAEHASQPLDPFSARADLKKMKGVVVVRDRAPLHAVAVGHFNDSYRASTPADGGPLNEDDAEWLADRLIEENHESVASGTAGALLLDMPGDEPTWLFFGWTVQGE